MRKRRLCIEDYTISLVYAHPIELSAAIKILDKEHDDLHHHNDDSNLYTFGSITRHNVMIACLPMGQLSNSLAATVAMQMTSKFKSLRFGLFLGIGGGVPSDETDIQLGDVVVSQPKGEFGGVVQYDFGTTEAGRRFRRTGFLNAPPTILLNTLSGLQAKHTRGDNQIPKYLEAITFLDTFRRDQAGPDLLFKLSYAHISGPTCDRCDSAKVIIWVPCRGSKINIYYRTIASGSQVIKDRITRDRLSAELGGIFCIEMEAVGLINDFLCLVIHGICNYTNSHKNDRWQGYVAVAAAAYTKELLSIVR